MTTLPAYDEIPLEFGGHTVFLRPSLRAATRLERLHDGFPDLARKIAEFDTRTVWAVITAAAGRTETDELFAYAATQSLSRFAQATQAPMMELVAALLPKQPTKAPSTTATTTPWSDVYRELFKIATGWLGWPPESAWNATPQEIVDALSAYTEHHNAIHGAPDQEDPTSPTEEQRQRNVELGLDPEFDRAGLQALKNLGKL